MRKLALTLLILLLFLSISDGQQRKITDPSAVTIARLQYDGGGNWYWGRSALPNLHKFMNENTPIKAFEKEIVSPKDNTPITIVPKTSV